MRPQQEVAIIATERGSHVYCSENQHRPDRRQIAALKAAVDTGEYATTSEIVREALRDWQYKRELRSEDLEQLRQLWDQDKASGHASKLDLSQLRHEARQRLKQANSGNAHAG